MARQQGARAKTGGKPGFKPMQRKSAKGTGKGRSAAAKQQGRTRKGKNGPRKSGLGNSMHPHSKTLIPTAIRSGDAFPMAGVIRPASLDCAVGDRKLLGVTNFGAAGTVMTIVSVNGINVSRNSYCIPLLALADDAGGPTSARAMKCGLSLVNTSPVLTRCGRVYHLNGTARVFLPALPSLMSSVQWGAFMDSLIAMPNATPYEGDAFGGDGKQFQCNVIDNVDYEDFTPFNGLVTTDEWYQHVAVWPGVTPLPRPMSTCWVIIESPAAGNPQTYNPTATAQFYTRWPLTSVPGQNMTPIPTADNMVINAMHSVSEAAASMGHNPLVERVERALVNTGRTWVGRAASMLGR